MTQPAAPAEYRVQTGAIQWFDEADGLHAYGYNSVITEAEAGPDFLRLVATTALVPVQDADLAPALDAFYGQFDHAPPPEGGASAPVDPVQAVADATGLPVETVRALDPSALDTLAGAVGEHPTTRLNEADLPAEASTAGSSARPSVADEA